MTTTMLLTLFLAALATGSDKVLRVQQTGVKELVFCEIELLDVDGNQIPLDGANAQQSSVADGAGPGGAVDGSYGGADGYGGCIRTNLEDSPYWTIQFSWNVPVQKVILYPRKPCCSEEIIGASVRMNGNVLGSVTQNENPTEILLDVIRIELPKTEHFSFCEVQVVDIDDNMITLDKTQTFQTSVYTERTMSGTPDKGVDGVTSGVFQDGGCIHTESESRPYWYVAFPSRTFIKEVRVFPRTEGAGWKQIVNAIVTLNGYELGTIPDNKVPTVFNMYAIRVQLDTGSALSVCEIEAFDEKSNSLSMVHSLTDSSSVADEGYAFKVNDGKTSGVYANKGCVLTEAAVGSFVTVWFPSKVPVTKVKVFPRTDSCCLDQIRDAKVSLNGRPLGTILTNQQETFFEMQTLRIAMAFKSELSFCEVSLYDYEGKPFSLESAQVDQSSIADSGEPGKAIDLNNDLCILTNSDPSPFWSMTFFISVPIGKVTVIPRSDELGKSMIIGAKLTLNGDTLGTFTSTVGPSQFYINLLRVGFPQRSELSFCEVRVWDENGKALNLDSAKAKQSSVSNNGEPGNAVDNSDLSCISTTVDDNPFWSVVFFSTSPVKAISVTPKMSCCAEQIERAAIFLNEKEVGSIDTNQAPTILEFHRLVVTLPAYGVLGFCDMNIFDEKGSKISPTYYRAEQSSVGDSLSDSPCVQTDREQNPSWSLYFPWTAALRRVELIPPSEPYPELIVGAEVVLDGLLLGKVGTSAFSSTFNIFKLTVELPQSGKLSFCEVQIFDDRGDQIKLNVANIETSSGDSAGAIDGTTSSVFSYQTCFQTEIDEKPFWSVHFASTRSVSKIKIFPRGGSPEQITGAQIRLNNVLVGEIGDNLQPKIFVRNTLRVELKKESYLSLCEVVAFDEKGETIPLLGASARQSSISPSGEPINAIDGGVGCARTLFELNPFWSLEFFSQVPVKRVTVSPNDRCCSEEIVGSEVSLNGQFIGTIQQNSKVSIFDLNVLRIDRLDYGELPFCEIQAFDEHNNLIPINPFQAKQSSVLGSGDPSNALDGDLAVCVQTNEDIQPFWYVAFVSETPIKRIQIVPSTTSRIKGAQVWLNGQLLGSVVDHLQPTVFEFSVFRITLPKVETLAFCEIQVFDDEDHMIDFSKAQTSQTSTFNDGSGFIGSSDKAIDGMLSSNGCVRTEKELNPTWTLALPSVGTVKRVNIIPSLEYAAEFRGAQVFLDGELIGTVIASHKISTFMFQTLRIELPSLGALAFCEVQAFDENDHRIDLSAGQLQQSSVNNTGIPSKALDGKVSGAFEDGGCIYTAIEQRPFWSIRFPTDKTVTRVKLFPLTDDGTFSQINGAKVLLNGKLLGFVSSNDMPTNFRS